MLPILFIYILILLFLLTVYVPTIMLEVNRLIMQCLLLTFYFEHRSQKDQKECYAAACVKQWTVS